MDNPAIHPRIRARFEAVKQRRQVEAMLMRARDSLAALVDTLSRLEAPDPPRQALIALAIEGLHQAMTALDRTDPWAPGSAAELSALSAALADLSTALKAAFQDLARAIPPPLPAGQPPPG